MTTRKGVIQGDDRVLRSLRQVSEGAEEFLVERDKDRPLRFRGRRIGLGAISYEHPRRGTDVTIYITVGGRYVTEVYQWQSTPVMRNRRAAEAHNTPEEALAWLKQDGGKGSHLGAAGKKAWLDACRNWEPLKAYAVEEVE